MRLKFGFGGVPSDDLQDAIDLAQLGESLGYDSMWMPDQTFYRDPFLVIAAAAQATHRIQFVLGVTNPFTRHPAQVARSAATLAEITEDRFSLGYGAGNRKQLILPLGMEQSASASRCREAVTVTRAFLAGETVSYHSEYLHIEGVKLLTPPKSDIQIYLAGRGPAILSAAGEVANGAVIGGLVTPDGLEYAKGRIADGEAARDPELGPLELISWVTCHIADDLEETIQRVKPNVAHIIGGAPKSVLLTIGFEEARIAELKQHYTIVGPEGTASIIRDEEVDRLTIVGDADRCADRIAQLGDGGIEQVGLLLTQPTPKAKADFVKRFAREIMPQFR